MSRGGMKESGIGRENGIEAFHSCRESHCFLPSWDPDLGFLSDTQAKSTIINTASVEETRAVQDWFAEDELQKRYG